MPIYQKERKIPETKARVVLDIMAVNRVRFKKDLLNLGGDSNVSHN